MDKWIQSGDFADGAQCPECWCGVVSESLLGAAPTQQQAKGQGSAPSGATAALLGIR